VDREIQNGGFDPKPAFAGSANDAPSMAPARNAFPVSEEISMFVGHFAVSLIGKCLEVEKSRIREISKKSVTEPNPR
jgi:hypothetical protein